MIPQAGWETITIHILPDISKSSYNQIMESGQLMKYIRRIFFSRNHAENVMKNLVLDPLKNKIEHVSGLKDWVFPQFVFIVCPNFSHVTFC